MRYFIAALILIAMFSSPLVRADDIYISCMNNNSMVRITDGNITTVATGKGVFYGLAVDHSGNLYLSNKGDNTIIKFEMMHGVFSATPIVFASGLKGPMDLAFDHEGNLYETDDTDNINVFVNHHGNLSNHLTVFADAAPEHANLHGDHAPAGLAFDPEGNMYESIRAGGILKFSRTASGLSHVPDAAPFAVVSRARQMAFDKRGNMFTENHLAGEFCVYKFSRTASGLSGTPEIFATGNGLDAPSGLAIDSEGNMYVTNWGGGHGTTVLQYPNKDGVLSSTPVIFGPGFACPNLVWCVKSQPKSNPASVPKIDQPETKQPPVPAATSATRPDLFYD